MGFLASLPNPTRRCAPPSPKSGRVWAPEDAEKTPSDFSRFLLARRDYSIDRFREDHHDTEDELKDIRQTICLITRLRQTHPYTASC